MVIFNSKLLNYQRVSHFRTPQKTCRFMSFHSCQGRSCWRIFRTQKQGKSSELDGFLKRALAGKGSKKSTGKKPSFRLVNDDNVPQIQKKSHHFSQVTRVNDGRLWQIVVNDGRFCATKPSDGYPRQVLATEMLRTQMAQRMWRHNAFQRHEIVPRVQNSGNAWQKRQKWVNQTSCMYLLDSISIYVHELSLSENWKKTPCATGGCS